jgi:3-methyl-2-oxobutanoate hydroxymethyltransferase
MDREGSPQIRKLGKDYYIKAEDVVAMFDYFAEDALAEIKKYSKLILVTIGAGSSGDIILSYMSDLSGDTDKPPRHAKAFGDVGAIRKQLSAEREKALAGYRVAVMDGSFPDAATSVSMSALELDRLKEGLDKIQPVHQ